MPDKVSKAEYDAEIVATCEAAVTRLTDKGWRQNGFIGDGAVRTGRDTYDLTDAKACLGGALVLGQFNTQFITRVGTLMNACPAVAAVADTIRDLAEERWVDVDPRDGDHQVIFAFNDADERTIDDVIGVLDDTIKRHTSEVIEAPGGGGGRGVAVKIEAERTSQTN